MRVQSITSGFLVLTASLCAADDEPRTIRGRVIDDAGRPVADADVATFWSANGLRRDEFQTLVEDIEENVDEIWRREGEMQPRGEAPATTDERASSQSSAMSAITS